MMVTWECLIILTTNPLNGLKFQTALQRKKTISLLHVENLRSSLRKKVFNQVIQCDLLIPQMDVTNNPWVRVTFSPSQKGHYLNHLVCWCSPWSSASSLHRFSKLLRSNFGKSPVFQLFVSESIFGSRIKTMPNPSGSRVLEPPHNKIDISKPWKSKTMKVIVPNFGWLIKIPY